MLDHMTVRVSDIEKSKSFYEQALKPLGYKMAYDNVHGGVRVVGFEHNGKMDTWLGDGEPVSGPTHFAWAAKSAKEVDEFYQAAMAAGGKDNGAPGLREHYHPKYYGAFVFDPDGNNLEAVYHGN